VLFRHILAAKVLIKCPKRPWLWGFLYQR